MDDNRRYEAFVRNRITELREQKGISEHRMSLELGKSGSYIRSITNGISMLISLDVAALLVWLCGHNERRITQLIGSIAPESERQNVL